MSKVLKAKYYPNCGIVNVEAQSNDSFLWKSWIGAKSVLRQGLLFQVGDGKDVGLSMVTTFSRLQTHKETKKLLTKLDE